MTYNFHSRIRVINYSNYFPYLPIHNSVLQLDSEKQQKFATIPFIAELQSQPHNIISVTQLNIYHNVIHQNQVVSEDKANKANSLSKFFTQIQPVAQVALFFVSLFMRLR